MVHDLWFLCSEPPWAAVDRLREATTLVDVDPRAGHCICLSLQLLMVLFSNSSGGRGGKRWELDWSCEFLLIWEDIRENRRGSSLEERRFESLSGLLEGIIRHLRARWGVPHTTDALSSLHYDFCAPLGDSIVVDQTVLPLLRLATLALNPLFVIDSLKAEEVLHVPEAALRVIAVVNDIFLWFILFVEPCLELSITTIQWLTPISTDSGDRAFSRSGRGAAGSWVGWWRTRSGNLQVRGNL